MREFTPDYQNIVDAANNIEAKRLPLYEHIISFEIIEEITGKSIIPLFEGGDLDEFFKIYCGFFRDTGYDTVSFERCIVEILPGGGALANCRLDPVIKTRDDFEKFPWDEIPDMYFEENRKYFSALRKHMPAGMKAIGGVGNGIFECVQDLTGYTNLQYIKVDEPDLYDDMFKTVGKTNLAIWKRFLNEFEDIFCVLRFGDDLGFKSNTLISDKDIKNHVIPEYKPIIKEIHSYGKPFLLHSCGCIFNVMEDLIAAGINAKHSNEDQIAPFNEWVIRYGKRIGNFGGVDLNAICDLDVANLREYVSDVLIRCKGNGGIAFGSGNSIPDFVPQEGYLTMIETVRETRGDYK